jgi:hypothetical protein
MATIDSNIAMGYRPIQIENPLNQLAAVSQIQANQQGQQLNALKIKETERELGENEEIRNYLAGANLNTPEGRAGLRRFGKTGLAYEKILAEQEKTGLERTKLSGEISKQQTERNNQRLRDLSRNPSNANIQAHFEDFELDNPNDARKIEDARRRRDYLLSADMPTRNAYLSSIGATASDLKPTIQNMDIGGSIIPRVLDPYSGLPISEQTPIKKTKTYADITAEGNLAVNQKELANKYNPVLQANLAEAKAAGDFYGKNRAAAAQALPGALENATQAIRLIDEMVGTAEVKDEKGKVIQAAGKPHKGFSEYVGAAFIPGTRFLEGSDVASFELRQKQIEGKAFLEAFNTLRGGGAITEKEGEKGTLAIMRMNKASSEKEYVDAARELQEVLRTGINTMRTKAGQPSGGGGKGGGGGGGVDTSNPLLK